MCCQQDADLAAALTALEGMRKAKEAADRRIVRLVSTLHERQSKKLPVRALPCCGKLAHVPS